MAGCKMMAEERVRLQKKEAAALPALLPVMTVTAVTALEAGAAPKMTVTEASPVTKGKGSFSHTQQPFSPSLCSMSPASSVLMPYEDDECAWSHSTSKRLLSVTSLSSESMRSVTFSDKLDVAFFESD